MLLDRLAGHLPDCAVRNLIGQSLRRCAERARVGGDARPRTRQSLAPPPRGILLSALDAAMDTLPVCSVRAMDALLVLAPTR